MRNTKNRHGRVGQRVVNCEMETMEERRLLAWGTYPQMMGLDQAISKYPTINGAGVAIVDIDTGISFSHPSLAGRIWTNPGEIAGNGIDDDKNGKVDDIHGWDFVGNDNNPSDDQGHGTMTAGLMVANHFVNWGNTRGYGGDNSEYQGVAAGAKVIPLRVIDASLALNVSNVEKALQWVIANYTRYNIVAVNMSLQVGAGYTQIQDELQTLWNGGVFVAASSGNWGAIDNDFAYPAGGDYAMSVGAQDNSTLLAGISCRGSALDIVAPGEGPILGRSADYWYNEPATSVATPLVTAAGALLKQINPAFTPAQIQSILRDSASTVYDSISKLNYKALDVDSAIALGLSRAGVTPTPVTTQTPFGGKPISLPGVVEIEDFDNGGEGVAYHDTTSTNQGGVFRSGGVDMQANTDSAGAINAGWTHAGEWLEYTVNIPAAGTYDLSARVASPGGGGTFHVEIDRANKSGAMSVPATGGFNTWTTISKKGISLPAGQHVLRIGLDTEGVNSIIGNLNWIKFTAASSTSTATSLTVQAENATALSGITKTATNLGYVDTGDWAQYKGLNLGGGISHFAVNIAVANINAGRMIEVRQGGITGKILGTLTVAGTGGYGIFKEQTIAIAGISGIQDLYLTFAGGDGVGNIDSFRLY